MKVVLPENDSGIDIAESALQYLKKVLNDQEGEHPIGIRVHVKKAGCSGYEYDLSLAYANSLTKHDYSFVKENVAVLIDKEVYLKFFKGGALMEYVQEGLNEGLQFKNPNVVGQCGCGESFTLAGEQ